MNKSFFRQFSIPQTEAALPFWVDGARIDYCENMWHQTGGWNPNEPNPDFPGNPLRNWHYTSTNRGVSWTPGTAPWTPRHTHAHGVYLDELYISGGNDVIDLWKWNSIAGWVEIPVTGVNIQLDHFGTTMVGKYIYFIGGNLSPTTVSSNATYKLDVTTGVLSFVGNVHEDLEDNCNSGCLAFVSNKFLYFAGGNFNVNPGPDINSINTKVFSSVDLLSSMQFIRDEPLFNSGLWGDCTVAKNTVWYQSGSSSRANEELLYNRTLYTLDGISWESPPSYIPGGRHACSMGFGNNDVLIGLGLGQNDMWRIPLLATNKMSYITP